MDAGIAAVLGATVGALGTGGAGIVAALLARSQVRLQVRAEHIRFLREPRKATYVAYAQATEKLFRALTDTRGELVAADTGETEPDYVDLAEAQSHFEQAETYETEWDRLQAHIYIEGPETVIDVAVDFSSSMTDYINAVSDAVHQNSDQPLSDQHQRLRELHNEAYGLYIKFLYSASDAANVDDITHSPPWDARDAPATPEVASSLDSAL